MIKAEKQTRAYIGVQLDMEKVIPKNFFHGGKPHIDVEVKNSGNSPAKNFHYVAGVEIEDASFPTHNAEIIEAFADGPIPESVLGAGEAMRLSARSSRPFTEGDFDKAIKAKSSSRIFFFGVIFYTMFSISRTKHGSATVWILRPLRRKASVPASLLTGWPAHITTIPINAENLITHHRQSAWCV